MKEPFLMMSLLIPGPKAPGKYIDVYLFLLVKELKELWDVGVVTYDISKGQHFHMQTIVLWTMNDFPAYRDLSGWSTKGYKACPICNEHTNSQRLRNKICCIGHCRYLDGKHSCRKSKQYDGKLEYGSPPKIFTGDDIFHQLQDVHCGKFGKNNNNLDRKRKRSPSELN